MQSERCVSALLVVAVIALLALLLGGSLQAATIYVPTDQLTIQGGIDAASDGDTVLVSPGTYVENVDYKGKAIVMLSSSGRDSTVIRPAVFDSAIVIFTSGEDTNSVFDGFTVTGATNAHGVECIQSDPIIRNCDISYCSYCGEDGAGIWCYKSGAKIRDNLIHNNTACGSGGGIAISGDRDVWLEIEANVIFANSGLLGVAVSALPSSRKGRLLRNVMFDNWGTGTEGAAIDIDGVQFFVTNNTLYHNKSGIRTFEGQNVDIRNNVVVGNSHLGLDPSGNVSDYNLVYGNGSLNDPGPHGLSEDPPFADPENFDFSLQLGSPCIDRGDPGLEYYDSDMTRNDIGALWVVREYPYAGPISYAGALPGNFLTEAAPLIQWNYVDTAATTQREVEIEVGTDTDWDVAEMWSYVGHGPYGLQTIMYGGLPLEDHQKYYLRIRVNSGSFWGSWNQSYFYLHLTPVIKVPSQLATIQQAVNWSFDGDSILVEPGEYHENISIRQRSVKLISSGGALVTTLLPADSLSSTFYITEEPVECEVRGFTFRGSRASSTLRSTTDGSCDILDNIFYDNSPDVYVISTRSAGLVSRNLLYNNNAVKAAIGTSDVGPDTRILNNTLVNNYRGVLGNYLFASPVLKNNIIVNHADFGVDGFWGIADYNDSWNNNPNFTPNMTGLGTHNISADPLFTDSANQDYTLQEGSPCVDAGDPDPQYNDPDGSRNDMGAFYLDYGIADPYGLNLGSEELAHVVSHVPTFYWSVPDTFPLQVGYELQVGIDNDWSSAEMWSTGIVWDADTSVVYSGAPLQNGVLYFARLRLHSGLGWASWDVQTYTMNSEPTLPVSLHPIKGESVPVTLAFFTVQNATDQQMDSLTYDFELHPPIGEASFPLEEQLEIAEQQDSTVSDLFTELSANHAYRWRARAFDGYEYSDWCPLSIFTTASVAVYRVPADYTTIQAAINAASSGDSIVVKSGTYTGTGNRDIDFGGKLLKLVSQAGPENTIIDCQGSEGDDHRGFNFHSGESNQALVKGFTIRNGYYETLPELAFGGGIRCAGASPTIAECVLENNVVVGDGGGLSCGGSPVLDSVVFIDNQAWDGNGIAIGEGDSPTLTRCHFIGNDVYCGGGGVITMTGCSFANCNVGARGGAITAFQGVYSTPHLVLTGCHFSHNIGSQAGAIYSEGAVLNAESCVFELNSTEGGTGAVELGAGEATFTSCIFSENWAKWTAGAVRCNQIDSVGFRECVFTKNECGDPEGAAVFTTDCQKPRFARCVFDGNIGHALLCLDPSGPTLDTCTFTRNTTLRGAVECVVGAAPQLRNCMISGNSVQEDGALTCYASPPLIENCIITFTEGGTGVHAIAGDAVVSCTDIYGNEVGDWVGNLAGQLGVDGNFSADPQFCDTATGDFRIHESSPCAPAGNDCGVRIGSSTVGCVDYLCGDANSSAFVDIDDVVFLINYVFASGPAPEPIESGDSDCSGGGVPIDIDDIVYLINYIFGGGPEPCADCP